MTEDEEEAAMAKTDVEVQLSGKDGNVFNIIGCVSRALRKAGHKDLAEELTGKAFQSGSYDEVLRLCMEYVEVN